MTHGYGVCNGISQLEQYMLRKIGIESESVVNEKGNHTFLKIKNIELPTSNGQVIKGDTIVDPTWDLMSGRFGAEPFNFCKTKDEIRGNDVNIVVDRNGEKREIDSKCHKNDIDLASANIGLDKDSLREVFKSIGVVRDDGSYPIAKFINESNEIAGMNLSSEQQLQAQLELVARYRPDFANCQRSTLKVLSGISLCHDSLNLKRCVAHRVYKRDDEEKNPVIYIYAILPTLQRVFYAVRDDGKGFERFTPEQFQEKFESYEMDIEKNGGVRLWETDDRGKPYEDLRTSSGNIEAQHR